MGDERGVGKFAADAHDAGMGEFDMGVTTAVPEGHFPAGLFHDPGPRFSSGTKSRSRSGGLARTILTALPAGADDVAQGLDFGAAINIGDSVEVGVGFLQGL